MKTMIRKTIEMLREKVKQNLTQIQNNQKDIRDLLKQQLSMRRTEKLEEKYSLNKALLTQNNDFINIQLILTSFLEKYEETEILSEEVDSIPPFKDENECFEYTINGSIMFDHNHPFYSDDKFFSRLLEYYQQLENYEKCSQLLSSKKQQ